MSDDRVQVIARIREALRQPRQHPKTAGVDVEHAPGRFSEWLPPVGESRESWVAAFRERSELLKTEFLEVTRAGVEQTVEAIARREKWSRAARHRAPLILKATQSWHGSMIETDNGYEVAELEHCDVSFTGCDFLVAQTGSVVGSTRASGGRALSVLPPHHVVVATMEQLVPDMLTALRGIRTTYGDALPSNVWFETGPSRTGDIERILVLGAHGPKKLTVLLLTD